ncbi:MAG: T9SS type A sorting domain-containing protein [Bacteroidales bacterium]|nr:T9SS type A sorting domain-containing protein [Bacteroidales bacterium]MCF8399116.1 T9SS type A sorting domain-containing protein [Bacteroidales bacterium]
MLSKKAFLAAIAILLITRLFSQTTDIMWQMCLGSSEKDYAEAVAKLGADYFFGITVYTGEEGMTNYHGSTEAWIVVIDSIGTVKWERCYGGSNAEASHKIIPINDTSLYLLNYSQSTDGDVQSGNNGWGDVWVVKINKQGNILWEQNYGGPSTEQVRDAFLTPDGGLLFMSRTTSAGGDISKYYGARDIWLCRIDSLGGIIWEKTIGNQGYDNALKMKLTSDSTFVVLANFNGNGGMVECDFMGPWDGTDIWLVEMDLDGNILRQSCYGGSKTDLGHDIVKTEEGYAFTAYTNSYDGDVTGYHGNTDFWVVKLDHDLNIIWQKCLGGSNMEYPNYITQTTDSGYITIGTTISHDGDVSNNHGIPGSGKRDIWMVKLNKHGDLIWEHCFGSGDSEDFDGLHGILKKDDHNFIIAGQAFRESEDVECDLYGPYDMDAWIFEIKDCTLYAAQTPNPPTGPDTLCHTTDSTSAYSISPAAKAWGYEWKIEPENAGNLIEDSLSAYVEWNQQYEGEVKISARSYNDCGNSDWSEVKKTWVYNCVGVEEIGSGNVNIRVYPNPAKSVFVVCCSPDSYREFGVGDANIQVFDVMGQRLEDIKVPKGQNKTEIDVSNWQKGLYFIKARFEDGGFGCVKVVVE